MRGQWAAASIVALTIGTIYLIANVARADAVHPKGRAAAADLRARRRRGVGRRDVNGVTPAMSPSIPAPTPSRSRPMHLKPTIRWMSTARRDVRRAALAAFTEGHSLETNPAGRRADDVRPLATGELGLAVTLPPGLQVEAWSLDPERIRAADHGATPGSHLAFAPDARHLAFLGLRSARREVRTGVCLRPFATGQPVPPGKPWSGSLMRRGRRRRWWRPPLESGTARRCELEPAPIGCWWLPASPGRWRTSHAGVVCRRDGRPQRPR